MKRQRLTRNESRTQTRAHLLAGAAEIFSRMGYAGASVDEIAEHAGYTKGAFYSNFASKEAIFFELLEEHRDQEVAALEALLREKHSSDKMFGLIAEYYATATARVDCGLLSAEFQLQAARDQAFAERFRPYFVEHRAALVRLLQLLLKSAQQRSPPDLVNLASTLMGLSVGLALQESALAEEHRGLFGNALLALLASAGAIETMGDGRDKESGPGTSKAQPPQRKNS